MEEKNYLPWPGHPVEGDCRRDEKDGAKMVAPDLKVGKRDLGEGGQLPSQIKRGENTRFGQDKGLARKGDLFLYAL
jgi:hypothetical protein